MSTKNTLILLLVVFLVGLATGRFTLPARVEIKEVIKTVEVEKKTDNKNTTIDSNKDTVVTVTKHPDGTITTETHYIDKSVTTIVDKKTDDNTTKSTDDKDTTTTYSTSQYHLSVMAQKDLTNLIGTSIGLAVDKKFIGPISLGIFGFTNKNVGLSIGLSF